MARVNDIFISNVFQNIGMDNDLLVWIDIKPLKCVIILTKLYIATNNAVGSVKMRILCCPSVLTFVLVLKRTF